MITDMVNSASQSSAYLRTEIGRVRWSGDGIAFTFRGVEYLGAMRGRNADLMLGCGEEKDKAIALRVLLDGDARAA